MRMNACAPRQLAACVSFLLLWCCLTPIAVRAQTTNRPPQIAGTPSTSVHARSYYWFRLWARDVDGDRLSYSIANKPSWAKFDATQGRLFGTPNQPGIWRDIRISVTDGQHTVRLPAFILRVTPALPANAPPVIAGRPATAVRPGVTYSFTPTAKDANGDALIYSIRNKPDWAKFDSLTGRLWGTPGAGGMYQHIAIGVSDRLARVELPAFSIAVTPHINGTVTLNWAAPEPATDAETSPQLAGYLIHYGTDPNVLDHSIYVANGSSSMRVIEGLPTARYYFAMRSVTSQWLYSPLSNVISELVGMQ